MVRSFKVAAQAMNHDRACRFCGQECRTVLTELFDDRFGAPGAYEIVECGYCGLEQTWPQPPERELKDLYERFYNWGGECDTAYTKIRERFLASGLYRLWMNWDGDVSFHLRRGSGRLLDVGCNEGRGLTIYARNGFQAEGLELNERAAAVARQRGFTVYTMPLSEFNPENLYDVVVLASVLEHAPDPLAMLRQVRHLLRPEGEAWIACPNGKSFWRRVFGRHWINWHVPFHLWHFSPQTLNGLLAQAHFHFIRMQTCTPAPSLARCLALTLGGNPRRASRLMRSAPVVGGLMLAARGLVLPMLGHLDVQMAGDYLIVTAHA